MGEHAAVLRVTVAQGKRLVIRDFKSSDPYVVVKLGNQVAKTKVINSCLNPVWNEELSFSFTDPADVLVLEVFDKDRFKADDKMGKAFLSLHPIALASRLKQILRVTPASDAALLRKVVPDKDNCIARESTISCVAVDQVEQSVWLKLREVESGEIELKVRLNDYPNSSPRR